MPKPARAPAPAPAGGTGKGSKPWPRCGSWRQVDGSEEHEGDIEGDTGKGYGS